MSTESKEILARVAANMANLQWQIQQLWNEQFGEDPSTLEQFSNECDLADWEADHRE